MQSLIDFRISKGLSRQEMARALGVSHSLYEKIELSARQPSRWFMERFKSAFPSFDMNIFLMSCYTESVEKRHDTKEATA